MQIATTQVLKDPWGDDLAENGVVMTVGRAVVVALNYDRGNGDLSEADKLTAGKVAMRAGADLLDLTIDEAALIKRRSLLGNVPIVNIQLHEILEAAAGNVPDNAEALTTAGGDDA